MTSSDQNDPDILEGNPVRVLTSVIGPGSGITAFWFSDRLSQIQSLDVIERLCIWVDEAAKADDQVGIALQKAYLDQAFANQRSRQLLSALSSSTVKNFGVNLKRTGTDVSRDQAEDLRQLLEDYDETLSALADDDPVARELAHHIQELHVLLELSLETGHWLLSPGLVAQVVRSLLGLKVGLVHSEKLQLATFVVSVIIALVGLLPPAAVPAALCSIGIAAGTSWSVIRDKFEREKAELDERTTSQLESGRRPALPQADDQAD